LLVSVVLHSVLADRLPRDARGRTNLSLECGASLRTVRRSLGIPDGVLWTVNRRPEPNVDRVLNDGDVIEVFVRIGGG
jgi:hypothetical protein